MVFFKRSKQLYLQYCHSNYPIPEWSLQQVRQGHWQLWCLQGNEKIFALYNIYARPWNGKREFSLKGRDSRRWLPGCKWLALSKWKTGTRIKITIAKEFSICSSWSSIIRLTWTFQHAKEISNMAIRLMQEVSGFKVWHFKTNFQFS